MPNQTATLIPQESCLKLPYHPYGWNWVEREGLIKETNAPAIFKWSGSTLILENRTATINFWHLFAGEYDFGVWESVTDGKLYTINGCENFLWIASDYKKSWLKLEVIRSYVATTEDAIPGVEDAVMRFLSQI